MDDANWLHILPLLLAVTGGMTSATPLPAREISFGLAKDAAWPGDVHRALAREYGLTDHATVYYNLMSPENVAHPFAWVREGYLKKGYGKPNQLVLVLMLKESSQDTVYRSESHARKDPGNLSQILGGYYDEQLRILAREIRKTGVPIIIRLMHEADGDWNPWGMYVAGNSPELFKDAWIHVVDIIRAEHAPAIFELNLNRRDANQNVLGDFNRYYPGPEYVALLSGSSYCRAGTAKGMYQDPRSFGLEFRPFYEQLAALTDLPINIAETGTSVFCGPQLPWYREQLDDIRNFFPRVEMVTYFLGEVPPGAASNDRRINWGFKIAEERTAFRMQVDQMRVLLRGHP